MVAFNELTLDQRTKEAISNMGFEETTPIQELTIPYALKGKDLIGQAQTGTGKTAAYGIPLIERIEREVEIKGLVLAPTRELAVQVAEELNRIGQFKGIRALPIYGGQDINRQIRALKKRPQIIVATPGRLMDHMRRKTIRLHAIEMVVLDEADEMLNMGFVEDIETILEQVPAERQTLLFSATMPKPIQSLAHRFMQEPKLFTVKAKEMTVPNTRQQYIEVSEKEKFEALCRLLDIQSPEAAIIFGRTKRRVDELSEALGKRGYEAEGLHGDLTQANRNKVLGKFRNGTIEILVATDVAARGLDISGVTHVYNFDIPQDPEGYVHRIGRTGRAGQKGLAVTFVTPREMGHLRTIESLTRRKMERQPIPSTMEAMEWQKRTAVDKLLETVEQGQYKGYKPFAEQLLADSDSVTLVAAALKLLTKEPDNTEVKLTEEPPLRVKKSPSEGKGYRGSKGKRPNSAKGSKGNKNWGPAWGKQGKNKNIKGNRRHHP